MNTKEVVDLRAKMAAGLKEIVETFEATTGTRVEMIVLLREDGELAKPIREVTVAVRLL